MTKTYRKIMPMYIADEDTIVFKSKSNGKEFALKFGKNLGEVKRVLLAEARREDVVRIDAKATDGEVTAMAYFFDDGTIGEFTEGGE